MVRCMVEPLHTPEALRSASADAVLRVSVDKHGSVLEAQMITGPARTISMRSRRHIPELRLTYRRKQNLPVAWGASTKRVAPFTNSRDLAECSDGADRLSPTPLETYVPERERPTANPSASS